MQECCECSKCGEPVNVGMYCKECNSTLHFTCAEVLEDTFRTMTEEEKSKWRCESCNVVCSFLPEKFAEFSISKAALRLEIDNTQQGIALLSDKFRDLETRMETCEQEISSARDFYNKTLLPNIPKMQAVEFQLAKLEKEHSERDQMRRLNNIEITGIPRRPGENLRAIMSYISIELGFDLEKSDIESIHRVYIPSAPATDGRPTRHEPVIVRFTQRERRDELLKYARARRPLTTLDAGIDGPLSTILLNDHLTPANKILLKRARKVRAELNYSYVWVKECRIYMRKDDSSKVIRIAHESDLLKLK